MPDSFLFVVIQYGGDGKQNHSGEKNYNDAKYENERPANVGAPSRGNGAPHDEEGESDRKAQVGYGKSPVLPPVDRNGKDRRQQ